MLFIVFIGIVTLGCGGLVGLEKEKNPVLTTTTIEGANSVMTIGVPYQLQDIPNKNLYNFYYKMAVYYFICIHIGKYFCHL